MLQANSEDYEIKFFFVFISQVDLVMDIFNSLFTLQVATSVISLCGGVFVVAFVCYFSGFPGKENNENNKLFFTDQTKLSNRLLVLCCHIVLRVHGYFLSYVLW